MSNRNVQGVGCHLWRLEGFRVPLVRNPLESWRRSLEKVKKLTQKDYVVLTFRLTSINTPSPQLLTDRAVFRADAI